jgi:predicted nucleotidyltransferase
MDKTILDDIVHRIVSAVKPEAIILFGSRARGETNPGADIDILVVGEKRLGEEQSRFKTITLIEEALGDLPYPIDILVYWKEEVESLRRSPNHVVAKAFSEGIILHGAA